MSFFIPKNAIKLIEEKNRIFRFGLLAYIFIPNWFICVEF